MPSYRDPDQPTVHRKAVASATGARERGAPGHPRHDDAYRGAETLKTAVLLALLLTVVATSMTGATGALLLAVVAAWVLMPLLRGSRDALEAGSVFNLLALGVLATVELADAAADLPPP